MIGTWEILFTLLIVLLLFGGKRLPEFAKSLGQGIREFKKASRDIAEEIDVSDVRKVPPAAKDEAPKPEQETADSSR